MSRHLPRMPATAQARHALAFQRQTESAGQAGGQPLWRNARASEWMSPNAPSPAHPPAFPTPPIAPTIAFARLTSQAGWVKAVMIDPATLLPNAA